MEHNINKNILVQKYGLLMQMRFEIWEQRNVGWNVASWVSHKDIGKQTMDKETDKSK